MPRRRVGWEVIGYPKRSDGLSKQPDHYAICECHEKDCSLLCKKWVNLSKDESLPTCCEKESFPGEIETILQCPRCTAIQGCDARDVLGGSLQRTYCASCPKECDGQPKDISRVSHASCHSCILEIEHEGRHPEHVRFYAAVLIPGRT